MTTPWRKALRDFWQEAPRTILVAVAVATGIASFTSVLAGYAILTRELNRGYLATNPASMTVRTSRVDDTLLRALAAAPGVRQVEARRVVSGRIKGGRPGWRNLVLFVIPDFQRMRVSAIRRERGSWPPATGEILIERDAFQVARVNLGDNVIVRTNKGIERQLRVAGSVHDVGQAQARMENIVYGYITPATLAQLGEEPILNQLKIVVSRDAGDERHVRDVAGSVRSLLDQRGLPVTRIDVPPPGKHPHADIMGLLMVALSAFGVFVVILSGVIVFNLLTALMAAQVRQIAVMKTVGATYFQIARIYLGQAMLLGLAAIVVGVPAGVAGSRALCRAMAIFLNFDITSFAIPGWVYLPVAIVGILSPLLAAAYPVMRGARISIRGALADFGVTADRFAMTALDRLLARVGGLKRPVLLAIRNAFRRRTRLALTVVTLAAGGLFFMTALNVRASMIHTLDRLFDTRKYDLSVTIAGMAQVSDVDRVIARTAGIRGAEAWIATEGSMPGVKRTATPAASQHGHEGGAGEDRFIMLALPPATRMFRSEIIAGRWLQANEPDAMVINTALANKSAEMRLGNRVTFPMGPGEVTFRIVGIAREPFSPPLAYIPRLFFDRRPGHEGMTNQLRIALDKNDSQSIDQFKGAFEEGLGREGIRVAAMTSRDESRFGFDQHMLMIYVALTIMSALIAGVGTLGLSMTMSLNVLERRREIGVLRAVGAERRTIVSMFIAEASVAAAIAWIVATTAAWPLSRSVGNLLVMKLFHTGLDFSFELRGAAIWLAVSVVISAIASFAPSWHATHRPVREALGYE